MSRSLASRFKTNVLPDGSLELTSFDATDYDAPTLEIPAKIAGRPVKSLGDFFSADSGKTFASVRLSAGLERIGDYAFADCARLSSLVFPSSLEELGVEAFEGCSALTQLVIPANVREIDFGAFARCAALSKIAVAPENPRFRSVDGVLFDAETKTLLAFPAGNDATVYVVPDGVERIAYGAFEFSTRLAEIVLPESVRSVGAYAFYECSGLTAIRFPAALCELGYSAFYRCEALRQVEFAPDATGLKTLPGKAFARCAALQNVALPNGLETIENLAFSDCAALRKVRVPASVKSLDPTAFDACSAALTLVVDAGSEAERFAKNAGIRFQIADEANA